MVKILNSVAFGILISFSFFLWYTPEQPDIKQYFSPRVRIKSKLQNFVTLHMGGGQCSGSIVQFQQNTPAVVVTAKHCIEDVTEAEVVFFDGSKRTFLVVISGESTGSPQDWAILKGDTQNILPLQVGEQEDLRLPMISFYVGRDQWIIPVAVVQVDSKGNLVVFGAVQPGDSGAAVLDRSGRIIGIIHSGYFGKEVGKAVPIWNVVIGLQKGPKDIPVANPQSEVSVPQGRPGYLR